VKGYFASLNVNLIFNRSAILMNPINPLKQREKRKWGGGGSDRHYFLTGGNINLDCGCEVPEAVPAHPSGKGRFGEGKAFGSGKGRMRSGARREVELQGLTAFVHNFEFCFCLGRAALGKNFDIDSCSPSNVNIKITP
jgi:hypothetical protein